MSNESLYQIMSNNKTRIISENASQYLQKNNIEREELVPFIQRKYNLKRNDIIFYEGNKIGYEINRN